MTAALDLVEADLLALTATMRATFAMVTKHPNYGKGNEADGEMLSDVGMILCDAADRLAGIYGKLDGQELASS